MRPLPWARRRCGSACAAAHSTGRDPKAASPLDAATGHRTVREMRGPTWRPSGILQLCALRSAIASPRCRSGYFDSLTADIWLRKARNCEDAQPRRAVFDAEFRKRPGWRKRAFGWGKWDRGATGLAGMGGSADAAHAGMQADVVSGFPRGLPDGDTTSRSRRPDGSPAAEACGLLGAWKPGRFLIGRDSAGRYVGHDDDRHILTVAGSRAGKGVSLIVPNLLHWPGSCIAIDPKGELATITASAPVVGRTRRRQKPCDGGGQGVRARSLSSASPARLRISAAAFNPLADLDAGYRTGLDMAGQIADALVMQIEGPGSHWTQSARSFLRGLILYRLQK